MGGGQVLCKQTAPRDGDTRYWLEPSGRSMPLLTCQRAIREGYILANNDGMFGDSQTFSIAPEKVQSGENPAYARASI